MDFGIRKAVLVDGQYIMMSQLEAEYHEYRTITIDSWSKTTEVNAALRNLARESEEEITIYVSGHGGAAGSALSIYDTIRTLKCPVCTVGYGSISELGILLLAAGTRGKRYIQESAEVLFEPLLCSMRIRYLEQDECQGETNAAQKHITEVFAKCMDRSVAKIEDDMEAKRRFSAEAAVAYGIADKIGDPLCRMGEVREPDTFRPVRNIGDLKLKRNFFQ